MALHPDFPHSPHAILDPDRILNDVFVCKYAQKIYKKKSKLN